MYNRYIPQPDGSYRRSQMPERSQPPRRPEPAPQPREPEPTVCEPEAETPPCRQGNPCPNRRPPQRPPQRHQKQPESSGGLGVGNFLRQLLPRDFDTEDLLIVLLLLLMSGDCREDQNTALLTLAIYLFM